MGGDGGRGGRDGRSGSAGSDADTSEQPSAEPSQGGGGASNIPTQAPTDTAVIGNGGPNETAWFLVVAFGVLVGSLFILRPSASRRER